MCGAEWGKTWWFGKTEWGAGLSHLYRTAGVLVKQRFALSMQCELRWENSSMSRYHHSMARPQGSCKYTE
jgi:hypothetical protein